MSIYKEMNDKLLWAGYEIYGLEEEIAHLMNELRDRDMEQQKKLSTRFKNLITRRNAEERNHANRQNDNR